MAKASFGSTPASFEDYRELLDRKDVDVVIIGTPDHWHVKMAVDALRAMPHSGPSFLACAVRSG